MLCIFPYDPRPTARRQSKITTDQSLKSKIRKDECGAVQTLAGNSLSTLFIPPSFRISPEMPASGIFILQEPPTTIAISDFSPISLPPWFGGADHVSWCQTDLFFLPAALYQVHQCSVQPEGGAGSVSLHLLGGTRLSRTRPKTATGCFGFITLAGLWGVFMQKCRIWRQTKLVNKQHLSFPWSLLSPLSHAALRE